MNNLNPSKSDAEGPEILVIPDGKTNRDFPSVAAGFLAALWEVPVLDFNTSPGNDSKRLNLEYQRWGFVAPSHSLGEVERLSRLLFQPDKLLTTANGPIDLQCCYPLLNFNDSFRVDAPFDDNLPFPKYANFDTCEFIFNRWKRGNWFYPIMSSLGCSYGCTYCACRRRGVQFRSIQHCVEELKSAKKEWGINRFVIVDDCFNAKIDRAKAFSEAVMPLDLEWMAGNGLRADRFDTELGLLMRASGCRWVSFGVESTDNSLLRSIHKGEKFQQIDRAVKKAKTIFDYVNVFLILGLPGSDFEKDKRSIEWAKSIGVDTHISFFVPHDVEVGIGALFDQPENRKLPGSYDENLQMKLYHLAKQ